MDRIFKIFSPPLVDQVLENAVSYDFVSPRIFHEGRVAFRISEILAQMQGRDLPYIRIVAFVRLVDIVRTGREGS